MKIRSVVISGLDCGMVQNGCLQLTLDIGRVVAKHPFVDQTAMEVPVELVSSAIHIGNSGAIRLVVNSELSPLPERPTIDDQREQYRQQGVVAHDIRGVVYQFLQEHDIKWKLLEPEINHV